MSKQRIDDVAAAWVARMDAGPLSADSTAALEQWLGEDPRHAGAFARARAVFLHLDRAQALGPDYDPARFAPHHPAPVPAGGRPWRWPWATAAAMVLAVVLATGSVMWRSVTGGDEFATVLGEVRQLPLADGSSMTLNTDSRVEVRMSADVRRIRLLRGEVLFDVAVDPDRPFVVESDAARVVAVGTSFIVRRLDDDAVEVLVREGSVRLERPGDPASDPAALTANTRALSRPRQAALVEHIRTERISQQLSWREGMLSFNGDTLAHAADEFARYSTTRIRIEDEAVAGLRVVGLFAAHDPAGFAEAVARSLGLVAVSDPEGIRLQARPAASGQDDRPQERGR